MWGGYGPQALPLGKAGAHEIRICPLTRFSGTAVNRAEVIKSMSIFRGGGYPVI